MALASISVDLDSLVHYCRIHALPESVLGPASAELAYSVAVPRAMALFAERSIPPTLFAIGEDLGSEVARSALRGAHRAGAEIGNHSQTHDYALSLREPWRIQEEVEGGARAVEAAVGERPAGFRAPGYTLSPALYQAVCAAGHRYDSSAFPAAPYYLAKAAVMGALAAAGRRSGAVLDSPRVLAAPTGPYFPDPAAPYRRGEGPAIELPITCAPVTRIPFIGTLVTSLPAAAVSAVYRTVRGVPLLNLELHALDFLDASDGIPAPLAARQRDARIPFAHKRARLSEVLRRIAGDFEVTTLAQAAEKLAAQRAGLV